MSEYEVYNGSGGDGDDIPLYEELNNVDDTLQGVVEKFFTFKSNFDGDDVPGIIVTLANGEKVKYFGSKVGVRKALLDADPAEGDEIKIKVTNISNKGFRPFPEMVVGVKRYESREADAVETAEAAFVPQSSHSEVDEPF